MKIFVPILLVASGVFADNTSSKNQCAAGANLKIEDMKTAQDIFQYIKKNKITSVGDLVCCLPKEYQENFIVGFASAAAQNGTPDSPRAIMFDQRPKKKDILARKLPPKFMISFNGGKAHNSQPNSLEIAQFNESTNELEFVDLQIEKNGATISKINPSKCMTCHGQLSRDSKGNLEAVAPFGGPKYIFDNFGLWPRFVGGIQNCSTKEDMDIHNILAEKAVSVVKSDPRYRCLDKSSLGKANNELNPSRRYPGQFSQLGAFDNANLSQETYRNRRLLRSLPEFEKYKYFLFGFEYCAYDKKTQKRYGTLDDWFPEDFSKELFKKIQFDERLKASGDLSENYRIALQEEWQKTLDRRAWLEGEAKSPDYQKGYTPSYSSMACKSEKPNKNLSYIGGPVDKKNIILVNEMDHALNAGPGGGGIPLHIRVFLNGIGKSTGLIATVPTEFESKIFRAQSGFFYDDEPADSKIRQLFKDDKDGEPQPIGGQDRVCAELKRLSKEQFGQSESPVRGSDLDVKTNSNVR